MPRRAPSICTYPGCGALVRGGSRCANHPYAKPSRAEREAIRKDYRKRVRVRRKDRANTVHFYNIPAWRKLRRAHLRAEPLCRGCSSLGRTRAGNTVDHIVPIEDGGERLDDSNLQTLCKPCHTAKTNRERAGKLSTVN